MNELQIIIETLKKENEKLRKNLEKVSKKSKARRNALKDLQRSYVAVKRDLELTGITYIRNEKSWWKFWGKRC